MTNLNTEGAPFRNVEEDRQAERGELGNHRCRRAGHHDQHREVRMPLRPDHMIGCDSDADENATREHGDEVLPRVFDEILGCPERSKQRIQKDTGEYDEYPNGYKRDKKSIGYRTGKAVSTTLYRAFTPIANVAGNAI